MAIEQNKVNNVKANNLIIVCCHAIWLGGPTAGQDENEWLIAPFQKGETPTFTSHMKAGLQALEQSPDSLLVFSGGPTKPDTKLSEGESYQNLVAANHFFSLPTHLKTKITSERHSLDSHQNLLFSLLHHHRLTGTFPEHITLISHAFKRRRFTDIHRAAICWPVERFSFIGIDPPPEVTPAEELREGEEKRGWSLWWEDWYGARPELEGKRNGRDVWAVQGAEGAEGLMGKGIWGDLSEDIMALVKWKGPEKFSGSLPWSS